MAMRQSVLSLSSADTGGEPQASELRCRPVRAPAAGRADRTERDRAERSELSDSRAGEQADLVATLETTSVTALEATPAANSEATSPANSQPDPLVEAVQELGKPASEAQEAGTAPRSRAGSKSWTHVKPIHVQKTTSLLSRRRRFRQPDGSSKAPTNVEFTGFKHLVMIMLVVGNLRLFWSDLSSLGFRSALQKAGFHSSDVTGVVLIFACNSLYLPIALFIERMAARLATKSLHHAKDQNPPRQLRARQWWGIIAVLHLANAVTCVAWSSWLCHRYVWNPFVGTICEANTILTFLKLSSYCLTVRDLREAYLLGRTAPQIYGEAQYPNNLTLSNLVYFWWAPTLVYQPVYPRTEKIRWQVIGTTLGEIVTAFLFMWLLVQQFAVPILERTLQHYETNDIRLIDDVMALSSVGVVVWLLGFFIIFQSALNFTAEITRFADREFYQDWWNAGSVGTFWRDWNKPISNYLRRHVYVPLRKRGVNRWGASVAVFFISAIFHELLVGVPTRTFNGVAFMCMMAQVPLIIATEPLEKMRGPGTTIGNCIFWLCMMLGQPTSVMIYYVSWNIRYGNR